MRHRFAGRILGRNASHRKAMFRNMMTSLILTLREAEAGEEGAPAVKGRITTTVAKAKELRPRIEKLITMAKKALPAIEESVRFATTADKNTADWIAWRDSDRYKKWQELVAPVVNARRRAFSALRDKAAVEILFSVLAPRYRDRPGGYIRILKIATVRLGDAGKQALVEFVGERDRVKKRTNRSRPEVASPEPASEAPSEQAPSTAPPEAAPPETPST